jgi:hypothetical protein
MKISRRNLLLHIGFHIPALVALTPPSLAESPFKAFQLVLSDITAETPADGLLTLLEPFVKARIPVSCIISLKSDAGALRPDALLAQSLRRLIADYPAQVEIILQMPPLTDRPYYFQSRMATKARQDLQETLLSETTSLGLARTVLTAANYSNPQNYEPAGVRAAGFRTVLSLPQSGIEPVDSRWEHGVLHIFGGMHFGLDASYAHIKGHLTESVRDDVRSLLVLSLKGLTSQDAKAAALRMTKIADLISELAAAGKIVPSNPTEYHILASPNRDTMVGVRLDVPALPDAPQSAAALELMNALKEQNIAFTLAGQHAPAWQAAGLCPPEILTEDDSESSHCKLDASLSNPQDNPAHPPLIKMAMFPDIDPIAGVDHQATLHPPRYAFVDEKNSSHQTLSEIRMLWDTVLVLDQRSYSSVAQRRKTTKLLGMLKERSDFQISDVASLVGRIQPLESIRLVYHKTQDVIAREQPALLTPPAFDRDLMLADAKVAWAYFNRFRDAKTGLIPSTAWRTNEGAVRYDYATMWDIGSQIFGMIAAVKLGLMTIANLNIWAERLITELPTVSVQGMNLPSSIIHTGGTEKPERSYNSCDVGRLLNAFDRLKLFSPVLKGIIDQKVAGWDLKDTIIDGHTYDFTLKKSEDHYISHCTNYAVRGFAAFGITAQSPYAPFNGKNDADATMELLFSASEIGGLGAEPLLFEGVEIGFSPEAKYLADMLFAAQLEDYRATGKMRCVSEGPLSMEPWFSYQGYNLNNFADPWGVNVISDAEEYNTPEFLRSIEMVSVKSAYLWAATYPHPYSHALVDYVRTRARIENFGFSSGVYRETGLPIKDYSDLNTNSVILASLAQILDA